jgi:hypothetical protein
MVGVAVQGFAESVDFVNKSVWISCVGSFVEQFDGCFGGVDEGEQDF